MFRRSLYAACITAAGVAADRSDFDYSKLTVEPENADDPGE